MRKTALAASGFALVLALSACGGEEGGNPTGPTGNGELQSLIANVSDKTAENQSAKVTMDMTMSGKSMMSSEGEFRFAGKDTQMAMTTSVMGMSMEVRLVDQTLYMKLPEGMKGGGGKPWVAVKPGANDPASQQLGQQFEQMEQSDPRRMLEYIEKAGTLKSSEKTTLNGGEVTHYVFDLDFSKIADQVGGGAGLAEQQVQQLASKVKTLPMEMWLNSDQLPVQVSMNMTPILKAAGAPAGQGQKAEMVVKYSDWGTPVEVKAPPADQIGKMPTGAPGGTPGGN